VHYIKTGCIGARNMSEGGWEEENIDYEDEIGIETEVPESFDPLGDDEEALCCLYCTRKTIILIIQRCPLLPCSRSEPHL